ncbi:alkaline phosphatase [Arcticibacterium luteifluviistationis]|uniref:Alkaline phosphatase n=1 Tax=Arcticibacterium luteifluviistationis TaxID=1784714 RepID=A0A2Z4GIX1_9BACT|nr:alkaline phosphatase [Arcticibacterium luteifluviistationis]
MDTMLLESYTTLPANVRQFYLDARSVFEKDKKIDFTDSRIVKAAAQNKMPLMAGPMLGDIKENGVSIWLRPSNKRPIRIKVTALGTKTEKTYTLKPAVAGKEERIVLNDLSPATKYKYVVLSRGTKIGGGAFETTSKIDDKIGLRLAFASDFHKVGLHNPNLVDAILKREPIAMMLLGDLAVDDRENNMSMHRTDYLLRDVSEAWQNLSANVPLYAAWDDHDYLNNDLSGLPEWFTKEDRTELRNLWRENWNNPKTDIEGINFNTRIGQLEIIMLDTRSYRTVEQRGQYDSYLGKEQLSWLKNVLAKSTAPFKIISSGTMWSDYISNGKDSWGTWDTQAREEIYKFIETENIPGVLLLSGDRHGARGFTIPRDSGFEFYEFGPASLGGVPGPEGIAKDSSSQMFGYLGLGLKAFGEFTFNMEGTEPIVTFRLIDELGNIMEEHTVPYSKLTPVGK